MTVSNKQSYLCCRHLAAGWTPKSIVAFWLQFYPNNFSRIWIHLSLTFFGLLDMSTSKIKKCQKVYLIKLSLAFKTFLLFLKVELFGLKTVVKEE